MESTLFRGVSRRVGCPPRAETADGAWWYGVKLTRAVKILAGKYHHWATAIATTGPLVSA